ncbi:MAG: hypothetical protein LC107_04625 [Chitinophagales bacterium]|nr:hypothetical protein [Chitinophagales bacterium]
MKTQFYFLAFFICTTCLFSCEKDDIRDSYVGTYVGTETYTNNGRVYTRDTSITVTKSSNNESSIIISASFFKIAPDAVTVEVRNGKFSAAFTSLFDSATRTVNITNGLFSGQKISYSYSADGYVTTSVSATKL